MLPRWIALGIFWMTAYAQAPQALGGSWVMIPADRLGLEVTQESGAITFRKNDLHFTYVEGIGWTPPLEANLPPPQGTLLALEVVRAVGLITAPEAPVRFSSQPDRFRLVLDLPTESDLTSLSSTEPSPFASELRVSLPYFLPGLQSLLVPSGVSLDWQYEPAATVLTIQVPPERVNRYRTFVLSNPARFVLDVFFLQPEVSLQIQEGFRYRELWAWTPEPVRIYWIEADPGRWRMEPVGRPGQRQLLSQMAPQALAILNGGYFDAPSGTPIGLWVRGGVPLSPPFGRSALLWQDDMMLAGRPSFAASVQLMDGRSIQVGVNLKRARYTVYTLAGPVGRTGEHVHLVQGHQIIATHPAPVELPEGLWALAFPAEAPIARTGETIRLLVSLDPPVSYALEAGPLLIQSGQIVFDPRAEYFRDRAPVEATAMQSAVAWSQEGGLWLVVTEPMRPAVLARVLHQQGFWGAIRMDGGGSAQLWVHGQLRNPVSVIGGVRPVVSGLALYPRP